MNRARTFLFKGLLSAWIVFHALVILIMPNGASYPGRAFSSVLYPYAALLGMNTSWNFFSPDPAHTMYLKFTIHKDETGGDDSAEPLEIFLPANKDGGEGDVSKRRELYAMRYMLLDPRRVDAVLGPWLCRTHAGASSVHVEFVINSIPSLDEATMFSGQDLGSMGKQFDFIDRDYRCSQTGDEVGL